MDMLVWMIQDETDRLLYYLCQSCLIQECFVEGKSHVEWGRDCLLRVPGDSLRFDGAQRAHVHVEREVGRLVLADLPVVYIRVRHFEPRELVFGEDVWDPGGALEELARERTEDVLPLLDGEACEAVFLLVL